MSKEAEPEIYETTRRFGTILENVGIDVETRRLDLDDDSLTQNTRAAYPISHIANATRTGMAGHPENIIFLTADAFGVLPPISRLSLEQASITSCRAIRPRWRARSVASQNRRRRSAPVSGHRSWRSIRMCTRSCWGRRIRGTQRQVLADQHGLDGRAVWRRAAHGDCVYAGDGDGGAERRIWTTWNTMLDPVFGLEVPTSCPNVPSDVLSPRDTWPDGAAYDAQAEKLADDVRQQFQAVCGSGAGGSGRRPVRSVRRVGVTMASK